MLARVLSLYRIQVGTAPLPGTTFVLFTTKVLCPLKLVLFCKEKILNITKFSAKFVFFVCRRKPMITNSLKPSTYKKSLYKCFLTATLFRLIT